MMTRALLLFSAAFLLLLLYEYIYDKFYKNRQLPLTLGFPAVFCLVVYRVASAYLGALAILKFFPPADRPAAGIKTAFGLFAGLWAAAVLLQLAQNAVRVLIGAPTFPVSLIRVFPPKAARRNKT